MENKLFLEIVTPEGKIFSNSVKSVQAPGSEGELGILANHAPIITMLNPGVIEIVGLDEKKDMVAINWGYLKVEETKVSILADGAVHVAGSSESEIAQSLQKAKDLINSMSSDGSTYASIISRLDEKVRN